MNSRMVDTAATVPSEQSLRPSVALGLAGLGLAMAGMVVVLVSMGLWYVAVVLLAAAPGLYLLHRYPFSAVIVWVALAPLLMSGGGGVERRLYWLVHRALPLGAIVVLLVARWLGVRKERFPKLGWPEAMIGGYLLFTAISIAYRSGDTVATYIYMYDHVVVPVILYLLVRLLAPGEKDFHRLVPALIFFLLSQSAIGLMEWAAPERLPAVWTNRENRASGTLRHPNVFAVTLLFAGLYLAHYGRQVRVSPMVKRLTGGLLGLALGMAVVTMSRASWLAAFLVVAGLFFVYRSLTRRLVMLLGAAALALVLAGGALAPLMDAVGQRFYSDASAESALSRLPVVLASLRMIEARPLIGWGYENFDLYDHGFVSSIEGLYVPDKDHASHNFFLTLGAESGFIGLLLYLGPLLWWLGKSRSGWRRLPRSGFRSRKLVAVLWLAMAAQVLVYNFSNNRVAFGLGVWWLTVGLLADACDWRDRAADEAESDLHRRVTALRAGPPQIDVRRP